MYETWTNCITYIKIGRRDIDEDTIAFLEVLPIHTLVFGRDT